MTDAHSQSTGTTGEAAKASDTRGEPPLRSSESWIDRLRAVVGWKPTAADLRENLESALDDTGEGGFSAEEREMIRNILRLRETRVDDVMVARADIEGIDEATTLERLLLAFMASGHSRMPVYRESLDEAVGMIHIRDLMSHVTRAARLGDDDDPRLDLARADLSARLADTGLVRPVLFVPGTMPASDLLARMQSQRIQMALVIDEYGGVDGLISMEDIVETVVGDIEDEHDEDEHDVIVAAGPGRWIVDARAELDDTAEATGWDFSGVGLDEEVETIGGLVVSLAGRVPAVGETFLSERLPDLAVEILDADQRRLKRLGLRRIEPSEGEAT
ncbi:hemolysin family protein [Pinisolibacter aquiterrae]|uniref:hemolysin family protein n=1 Tax=Pinisolibacter aquiterrae TaxID=2815579 RepID=UPI001C3C55B3|nr:hemolysin family protein [Pinisolibacter aquiterrae]MBV5266126.1 HlyC/CorC family transporter [Pinisolibacter aquiterrae]MCC8236214.1 hemolysin family protein [Pinisolibacter aquiterrae]